jgi:hypothetical protein
VELHAVEHSAIVDRAGVGSASTKGLEVGLSRPCEILLGDRRERQQLDFVDLDHHRLCRWRDAEAVGDATGTVFCAVSARGSTGAERAMWGTRHRTHERRGRR